MPRLEAWRVDETVTNARQSSSKKGYFRLINVNSALTRSLSLTIQCKVGLDIEARFELTTDYSGALQDQTAAMRKAPRRGFENSWTLGLTVVLRHAS
jgi:hypothetical protein